MEILWVKQGILWIFDNVGMICFLGNKKLGVKNFEKILVVLERIREDSWNFSLYLSLCSFPFPSFPYRVFDTTREDSWN